MGGQNQGPATFKLHGANNEKMSDIVSKFPGVSKQLFINQLVEKLPEEKWFELYREALFNNLDKRKKKE